MVSQLESTNSDKRDIRVWVSSSAPHVQVTYEFYSSWLDRCFVTCTLISSFFLKSINYARDLTQPQMERIKISQHQKWMWNSWRQNWPTFSKNLSFTDNESLTGGSESFGLWIPWTLYRLWETWGCQRTDSEVTGKSRVENLSYNVSDASK